MLRVPEKVNNVGILMITGQRGKTGWDMSKWPKGGVGIKGKWKVA